jgi:hypothetical protein
VQLYIMALGRRAIAGRVSSVHRFSRHPPFHKVMTPKLLPITVTVTVTDPVLTTRCVLGEGEPRETKYRPDMNSQR